MEIDQGSYYIFILSFFSLQGPCNSSTAYANGGYSFLIYETEFVLFLAVLENSVLPMD